MPPVVFLASICDIPAPHNFSGTWNQDNTIVFSSGIALLRVAAEGGQPTVIATLDRGRGETALSVPDVSARRASLPLFRPEHRSGERWSVRAVARLARPNARSR